MRSKHFNFNQLALFSETVFKFKIVENVFLIRELPNTFEVLLSSNTRNNSSGLCWEIKTLSAEVMQPLHARQSDNVTWTFCKVSFVPYTNADNILLLNY